MVVESPDFAFGLLTLRRAEDLDRHDQCNLVLNQYSLDVVIIPRTNKVAAKTEDIRTSH